MLSFALITEGVTDFLVLDELLNNFFKNEFEEEIEVNQIQPLLDATDTQTTGGGWNEVIRYCKEEDLKSFLDYNDYIIIQIDADIVGGEDDNFFKIPLIENRTEVYNEIVSKLQNGISQYTEYDKFIFAIGIDSIECWLLGIIDKTHKPAKVVSCITALNTEIGKDKSLKIIPPKAKENSKKTYTEISGKLKKKKDIISVSKSNLGFEKFVEQLENVLVLHNEKLN